MSPGELTEVIEALLEGLQVLSPDWRYLHVNEQAARHGRTTPAALLGRRIQDCYPGIEATPLFEQMQRCMNERVPITLENEFTYPDGSSGWFELRIQPVPQGICVLSIDVSARKNAEAARQAMERRVTDAERADCIGRLAADAAHDFNNHLTLILNVADGALRRPDETCTNELQAIVDLTRSAAQLTRELLTAGSGGPRHLEPVDLSALVLSHRHLLRSAAPPNITPTFDLTSTPTTVLADRSQLERVLILLVSDAFAAMPDGGALRITVRSEAISGHAVVPNGEHAVLEVSDTSPQSDQRRQPKLFEPRQPQEPPEQRGFGLTSIADVVRQLGGHVEVTRGPDHGSKRRVLLPMTALAATVPVLSPMPARNSEHTILVVDDTPEVGDLICQQLLAADHHVLLATSGEQAIELWDQHADQISLLLTDMMLAGTTGSDLIRRFRSSRPDLVTLCMSGYLRPQNTRPDDHFLEKPFTGQELRERVQLLLEQRSQAS